MFRIGDYVVYGSSGVCKIIDIGTLSYDKSPEKRLYYTMEQCFSTESKICIPVDNDKVFMRHIIDRENAMALIDDMKNIEVLNIRDEKRCENDYKEAMRNCSCRDLVKVIKTIYNRKQSRIAAGKKMTAGDEKYFKLAENSLYGEMAVALNMAKDEVRDFICARLEEAY